MSSLKKNVRIITIIRKNLLSNVLEKEVTNIEKGCTENELKITAYFGIVRQSFYFNIYELADLCKKWIEKTSIYSFIICEGVVYVDSSNSLLNEGGFYFDKKFYKHTEIENILTACQWLFENKRIKL